MGWLGEKWGWLGQICGWLDEICGGWVRYGVAGSDIWGWPDVTDILDVADKGDNWIRSDTAAS